VDAAAHRIMEAIALQVRQIRAGRGLVPASPKV
jgi:hypothetical protein